MAVDSTTMSSANLEHFFRHIDAAVTLIDKNYRIVWSNDTFRNWFGKPKNYLCYKIHNSEGPCQNCPCAKTFMNNISNFANIDAFNQNARKNPFRFTSIPLRNSGDPRTDLVLEIIETKLNPVQKVEEHRNLAIFLLDQNGTIVSTNPEHLDLADAPADKVLGLNWLNVPKSSELGLSKFLRRGLRGEPFELFNFRYLTYRGDKDIYMNILGLPLQRLDPKLTGLLCLALDATNKYQSERNTSIIGRDPSTKALIRHVHLVAGYSCPVLIEGESGTGKELVANEIYTKSQRNSQPFIIVNAGALPDTLLESELFGYAKGAFTGAHAAKQGLFEIADNGTFFIDEVGEMSPAMQVRLLRILENGVFRPLGSLKEIKVNVRIIAATNRNLEEEVKKGTFREDLFYRLNVFKLTLSPLRERKLDIPLLAQHFLERENNTYGEEKQFSWEAMEYLLEHPWPGNVRQLANVVKSSFILAQDDLITPADLAPGIGTAKAKDLHLDIKPLAEILAEAEQNHIINALRAYDNDKEAAARALGISVRSLYRKLQEGTLLINLK